MFEVGKRYWAVNGDFRIKVLCIARTRCRATFTADERDAKRYFGTRPKFTKKISPIEVAGADGMWRECVMRLSDKPPGYNWCITDMEVGDKVSAKRRETKHVGTGVVGLELPKGEAVDERGVRRLLRKAHGIR